MEDKSDNPAKTTDLETTSQSGNMFPSTEPDTSARPRIPATVLERRLIRYLLLYPIVLMVCAVVEVVIFRQGVAYTAWLRYVGSPVVAAILICMTMRRYHASQQFLRIFFVLTFLGTILSGGFYYCATLSHNGSLVDTATLYIHKDTNLLRSIFWPGSITNLFASMTVHPSPAVGWLGAYSNSLLSFPYSYLVVYGNMVGPYFLLLMLITPRFLTMPVFWLWVVLSVLYVVLPSRTWKWTGNALRRAWSAVRRRTFRNASL